MQYETKYFERHSKGDKLRRISYRQEYKRICDLIPPDGSRKSVLDIGCGTGEFLDCFPDCEWDKNGIEVSEHARLQAVERRVNFCWNRRDSSFDLVVFRGAIQHLDRPLDTIHNAVKWLKPHGIMAFLATPNAGSLVYRLWQNLPALDPQYNYVVFSAAMLKNCLKHFGLKTVAEYYPYLGGPYANFWRDLGRFLLACIGIKRPFAWFGNMMEIYARKDAE